MAPSFSTRHSATVQQKRQIILHGQSQPQPECVIHSLVGDLEREREREGVG